MIRKEDNDSKRIRPYIEQIEPGMCQMCKRYKLTNSQLEQEQSYYNITFCKQCSESLGFTFLQVYQRSLIGWLCDKCTRVENTENLQLADMDEYPIDQYDQLTYPDEANKEIFEHSELAIHIDKKHIRGQLWGICKLNSGFGVLEVDTNSFFIIETEESALYDRAKSNLEDVAADTGGSTFRPQGSSIDDTLEQDLLVSNI